MRKNTLAGLALVVSVASFGCGSSNDTNTANQNGSPGDASAGTSGSSGNSGTGNGTSGTGNGTSGTGTGTSGTGNPNAGGTGQGGAGTSGTSNAGGTGQGGTGTPIVDGGKVTFGNTQCTDGKDNDGDGLIDSADPECTGPLDNDESSFATGIPGDNIDPKWQDCFFDGNSGGGDDGCRYNTGCLTGDLPQTDPSCKLSQQCINFCMKYTPNGCDCFGCCKVPLPSGAFTTVQIAGTCTLADIGDPQKCPPCVQSAQCNNTCGTCELCVGKDTLPPSCTPSGTGGAPGGGGTAGSGGKPPGGGGTNGGGGTQNAGGSGGVKGSGGAGGSCPTPACPQGQNPCGVSCLPACPGTQFCLTGCCIQPPA